MARPLSFVQCQTSGIITLGRYLQLSIIPQSSFDLIFQDGILALLPHFINGFSNQFFVIFAGLRQATRLEDYMLFHGLNHIVDFVCDVARLKIRIRALEHAPQVAVS